MLPLLLLGLLVAFVANIIYKRASLASRRKFFQQKYGCQPPKQYLAAPWWDQYGLNLMRNMLAAARKNQLLEYVQQLTRIHDPEGRGFGNFVAVGRFGTRRTVFTSDPENMKSVLTRADDFVVEPSRLAAFEGLLGKGIFTADGAFWQHSRNMLKPQFDKSQITELEQFERHIPKLLALIPDDGSTIDLQPLFHRLTMDTSTEFLTGTSANSLDADDEASQEARDFVTAFELAMEEGTLHARLGKLYNLFPHPAARRANAISRGFIQKWVDRALQNKAKRAEKAKKGEQYVFIDELVKHDEVDRTRALNETMNILLAGRDTTATLLSHLFFNLAREPEVWRKLLAEIDELNGELPSYERLRDMKYLRYCTQETLRLHPPVPMLSKAASRDTTIPHGGGADGLQPLFIAKGDNFFYSSYALQRSEAVYGKDAHIFRPERWSDPNLRPFWAYIPFGGGQRVCLGQQYALAESYYVTVRIMQTFRRIEDRDGGPWFEKVAATLGSKNGVMVGLFKE
ncbi:Cytochrome P450 monooxygenase [Pseudocercospora fuligena]|uniref:Cytochrome P450 monooxygenase n=1 Tax=Pseudocercospora fuligena TaxID=685502 RepID=A0A8H6RKT5_9PEZI|nr:Cytochrome P450 monooxygenase [Pseudocercospora fuligena]